MRERSAQSNLPAARAAAAESLVESHAHMCVDTPIGCIVANSPGVVPDGWYCQAVVQDGMEKMAQIDCGVFYVYIWNLPTTTTTPTEPDLPADALAA